MAAPRSSTAFAVWALIANLLLAHSVIAASSTQLRGNQDTPSIAMIGRQEGGHKRNLPTVRHSHTHVRRLRRTNTSEEPSVKTALEPGKQAKQIGTAVKPKAVNDTQQEESGIAHREVFMARIAEGLLHAVPMQLAMKMQGQSTVGQAPDSTQPNTATYVFAVELFFMVAALTLLFAYYYSTHRAHVMDHLGLQISTQDKNLLEKSEFAYSLFACLDEPKLCLFTCCCAPVRWADTLRMLGLVTVMTGTCIYLLSQLLGYFLPGGTLILIATLTLGRQELRAKFDMPHGTCMSYMEDCCAYCWCGVCAITQDARQVELAAKVGHPAIVKEE